MKITIWLLGITDCGYQFKQDYNAASYLGGEPPTGFVMSRFEFNAPSHYLGMVSKNDEAFAWLPFDLHLVAPIYLNIDKLFNDCSFTVFSNYFFTCLLVYRYLKA